MKQQAIGPETQLTSYKVSELLQVNPSSVNKWVKDGRIEAFRTPGGHHRIRAADLVSFLRGHQMRVPAALIEAGRRRLLVLEAEPKLRASLVRQLAAREEEIEARVVEHGVDALIELGAFAPHLALIDLGVAGIDGLEVCERLAAVPATAHTRVILCATRVTPKLEKRAAEVGAASCLPKPVGLDELVAALNASTSARGAGGP